MTFDYARLTLYHMPSAGLRFEGKHNTLPTSPNNFNRDVTMEEISLKEAGSFQGPEVEIVPFKRIVIHELIEYRFNDLADMVLTGASVMGGGGTPFLLWCNGVVFQTAPLDPESETIAEELLKGTIHYGSVVFALKEKFEAEVRTRAGIIRLIDQSASQNFVKLAEALKANSKLKI